jgi:hypothetical protein
MGTIEPLNMLMFARDNKFNEIEAALALGIPPDVCNQVEEIIIT